MTSEELEEIARDHAESLIAQFDWLHNRLEDDDQTETPSIFYQEARVFVAKCLTHYNKGEKTK